MTRGTYSADVENPSKVAQARGNNLRVHFKKTRETAAAIKGMSLVKAQTFLSDVIEQKQAVPMRRFTGGGGRHAQGKAHKHSACRWPKKSSQFLLDLLVNAQSNAEAKELEPENMIVQHIQVNRAPKQRRRTYRAHGRIGPYMCSPCHVELIAVEKEAPVPKPSSKSRAVV
mmetsp:Transcript_18818/g.72577  ORF Transcript_18818/g.72577 Transcript_18818/m.72577 type:complete len:171 (-) Transcript_18818:45-557(-)|eukprot:CAMPEP_0114613230 /NCGR_PEP_ID=MMETSP0168-20121206/5024_1 /TAXON_ID=95228 ORGANISM="Vannella sp., Strain DIVA3 517/6/12" /NCGR_SAMPLE_ID=MMETSP0168 /ASSEMBLY_ACC=CAM_ASM_000044 /LENGTH=170 /DNA_ID=CAMNT_0001824227 /DNA_START=34 /DNA_END=546 /DNA_ORIENTATION=+